MSVPGTFGVSHNRLDRTRADPPACAVDALSRAALQPASKTACVSCARTAGLLTPIDAAADGVDLEFFQRDRYGHCGVCRFRSTNQPAFRNPIPFRDPCRLVKHLVVSPFLFARRQGLFFAEKWTGQGNAPEN